MYLVIDVVRHRDNNIIIRSACDVTFCNLPIYNFMKMWRGECLNGDALTHLYNMDQFEQNKT